MLLSGSSCSKVAVKTQDHKIPLHLLPYYLPPKCLRQLRRNGDWPRCMKRLVKKNKKYYLQTKAVRRLEGYPVK